VGALINQVASANAELQRLDDEVATRREEVNKALVDLQNARDAADVAAQAVSAAQQAVTDAGAQIDAAQHRFDEYAARMYTQGNGAASIASYFGSQNPDEVLDRAQALELVSRSQQSVLDSLQRARMAEANKASTARKAKQDADAAAVQAEEQKSVAEQAIATARAAFEQQASRKAQVEQERGAAQYELDAARSNVAGLQGQREAYLDWMEQAAAQAQQAPIESAGQAAAQAQQAPIESAGQAVEQAQQQLAALGDPPAAGPAGRQQQATVLALAETAKQIAIEATARVAADQAARDRAAALAAGTRPHTAVEEEDEEVSPPTTTPKRKSTPSVPSVLGPAAVEIVVDRGMSQLGVPYAWGGGDENGPTKGIRDGGVADAHGDYKKVGFDCSGLMLYAFAGIGISLPHYSGYQYTAGKQVPAAQKKRGDMLFWGAGGSQHVALYLGDGTMLEAPQSGDVVKVSPVRQSGMMPYVVRMVS
jgi:cell wall-associated NlpC family hydrolase